MTTESETRHRSGRPPLTAAKREAAEADRDRRRHEYVDLRTRLGMSATELADVLGLSVGTVRLYPGWTLSRAPTDATLKKMRLELVRQMHQRLENLQIRHDIERRLLEDECRGHLARLEVMRPLPDMADAEAA